MRASLAPVVPFDPVGLTLESGEHARRLLTWRCS
jgi:hypothetical protein